MESTSPLWGAADQAERLAELTARSSDARKDAPLRRDVRSLGILLGRVLVEQAGSELFDTVERLRRLLIQHREKSAGMADAEDTIQLHEAKEAVRSLDLATAYHVA